LACNGEAFFILPHGILFRGQKEGKIRQTIVENNLLDAIIGLPDNMFLNTNIPVCIFCLKKNKNTKDVFFINAAQDFEKNGKQNFMSDAQIKKIVDVYKNRTNIDNFSKVVTKENIIDNDYNLNISRYVEDRQNKEEIDLSKEIIGLININNDIKNINKEISNILKEIHGDNQYENNAKQLIRWLEND
jgi:type I restriction enzyme M protein